MKFDEEYRMENSSETLTNLKTKIGFYLHSVKESVNVRLTTAIIYASRFTFIDLQKWQ
jgi:hypothetical protein